MSSSFGGIDGDDDVENNIKEEDGIVDILCLNLAMLLY
jgi:hypothetical protein